MKKSELYISADEAEESTALIVFLIGIMAICMVALSLWVGFRAGEQFASSGEIYIKSELTDSEINALNIAANKERRHARAN